MYMNPLKETLTMWLRRRAFLLNTAAMSSGSCTGVYVAQRRLALHPSRRLTRRFHISFSIFAALACVSALATYAPAALAQVNKDLPVVELKIKNHKLKVEVAATAETRTIGLMNRFSLAPDSGMLFVFPQSEQLGFWMRNTFIPLSIAYVDSKGVILNIADMKPKDESTHPSKGPAMFAVEMKQGWFKDKGIVAGDKVEGLDKAGRAKN
jgi:uncharacterized protein